jgi:hypothetical protein
MKQVSTFWGIIIIVAVAVVLFGGCFAYQYFAKPQAPVINDQQNPGEQVMCTMDAMECPDGSYVGRTGPNCEFVCPEDKKLLNDVYPLFSNLEWSQPGPSPMQRLPGDEVTATVQIAKNTDAREFFNYYDKKLKALGWTVDNSFSADGVTGSYVGYKKDNNEVVLSYNIKPGKVTSGANEPLQYTCPCDVTYTVFTTKIIK